jgi:hypothetical protein
MANEHTHALNRETGYTVREIMTAGEDLLFWTEDESQRAEVIHRARLSGITYIPVKRNGIIIGVITCDALEAQQSYEPLTTAWLIAADTPILRLIELFAEKSDRVFMVLQSSDIVGLVAPSDLNKIPARASVYLLLAHFEAALTGLVRRIVGEDEVAFTPYFTAERLGKLKKDQQDAKARDIDLPLLHYLYLFDLRTVVSKDERLYRRLGFPTRPDRSAAQEAEDAISFSAIRNPVSHLTNLLISSREDLAAVNDACERLIKYSRMIENTLD